MQQKNVEINQTIISRLEVGTYTYAQLMELLGWAINGNMKTRANQMLELQRHCLFEVVGKNRHQRYHILKVYDKPTTQEVFYRPNNEVYSIHPQVLVPSHLLENGSMIVYKIQCGNQVYIGSTKNPRNRISNHFNGYVNEHTYHMLQRGGTFEVLEHITTNEEDLRAREVEYIKEYKLCGVFAIINNKHAKA